MHDALARYVPDTLVADVEEEWLPAEPLARGRVATEDLTMHCRTEDNRWHRLHPNRLETACGYPFTHWGTGNTRSGRFPDHPLAETRPDGEPCDCWTRAERSEAEGRRSYKP